ncbi:IS3 family transposase, partial [Chania multitudinisentens]|uniref:IS3 family transposase n=1 Tax=Chania multitudinisentens TaxID=1639108 RepID=UPI0012DF768D
KKITGLNSARKRIDAKEKAKIVNELRPYHALRLLLRVVGLPRSTFYYQLQISERPQPYMEEKKLILDIFHKHKGRYGYRRITATARKLGYWINHKTIQRLMHELNIASFVRRKKYQSYKGVHGKGVPNHIQRCSQASVPNQKWVTDVTEFNINGKKLYLSPILDLYNSEIISYELGDIPNLKMVDKMLGKAIEKLNTCEKPILHSDQGWQYQMIPFQENLKKHGITQSMSRKGNCLDNAVIENFFGILKTECFHGKQFVDIADLTREIHSYIHYYNYDRIKMKLGALSPVQYRTQS